MAVMPVSGLGEIWAFGCRPVSGALGDWSLTVRLVSGARGELVFSFLRRFKSSGVSFFRWSFLGWYISGACLGILGKPVGPFRWSFLGV